METNRKEESTSSIDTKEKEIEEGLLSAVYTSYCVQRSKTNLENKLLRSKAFVQRRLSLPSNNEDRETRSNDWNIFDGEFNQNKNNQRSVRSLTEPIRRPIRELGRRLSNPSIKSSTDVKEKPSTIRDVWNAYNESNLQGRLQERNSQRCHEEDNETAGFSKRRKDRSLSVRW